MNKETVLNACVTDYCQCNYENKQRCACNGIAVFAKECQFQGAELKHDWRDMEMCRKYFFFFFLKKNAFSC